MHSYVIFMTWNLILMYWNSYLNNVSMLRRESGACGWLNTPVSRSTSAKVWSLRNLWRCVQTTRCRGRAVGSSAALSSHCYRCMPLCDHSKQRKRDEVSGSERSHVALRLTAVQPTGSGDDRKHGEVSACSDGVSWAAAH